MTNVQNYKVSPVMKYITPKKYDATCNQKKQEKKGISKMQTDKKNITNTLN